MVIDSVAAADVTGMPGSLEQAIGNASILQRSDGRFSDSLQLIQAFKNGDHHAQWVWLDSVRKLALAMASISNLLSPECFIIGGGITEAGKDVTIQFAIGDWWISDYTAFFTGGTSILNIECIQDAVVYRISRESMERLYLEIPAIESFYRIKMERFFGSFQRRILSDLAMSAKENTLRF